MSAAGHVEQFRSAMQAAGIRAPDDILDDGTLHRFSTNGESADDGGWYVLYGDGFPAGAFGDWRTDGKHTWNADPGHELTEGERRAYAERMETVRQQREAEEARRRADAAARAAEIWQNGKAVPADHAYLRAKGVQPPDGVRLYHGGLVIDGMRCDGSLIVPLKDTGNRLRTLEFIAPDGLKRFLPGGEKTGCYFPLAGAPDDTVLVAEGLATAATLREATGHTTVAAMCANNLLPAARAIRAARQNAALVIAGDNDESDTGQQAAEEAARAVGGVTAIPPELGRDWNDYASDHGPAAVRTAISMALARVPHEQKAAGTEGQRGDSSGARDGPLQGIDLGQLHPHLADGYSIKGLVLPNTLVGIIGASGAGKSFFAIDLALHVAAGRTWRGKRVKQGLVVYAALEAPTSAERRLYAAFTEGGYPAATPLRLTPGRVNLRDRKDVDRLIAFIREAEALHGRKCAVAIVDTLSRAMAGGDENSSEDMGALIDGADGVRLATGATVVLVHHLGKDETRGARGWSGLKAALDSEIWVEKRNGAHVATATKERDLPEGEQFGFRLKVVELGKDEDGDPVTTCVVEPTDAPRVEPRGKNQKTLMAALREWRRENSGRESISHIEFKRLTETSLSDRKRRPEAIEALLKDGWIAASSKGYEFLKGWDS